MDEQHKQLPTATLGAAESLDQVNAPGSSRSNSAFFRRRHRRSYHVTSPKDFSKKKKLLRTMLKSKNRDGPERWRREIIFVDGILGVTDSLAPGFA